MSNHVANQANAQFSTGPVTAEGKARSCMNALKHGLTGKTVLLPSEDPEELQRELDYLLTRFQPATAEEIRLVQSILECTWRLNRIAGLEAAILFKGHIEFADKYEDRTESERRQLIQADAYLKYEKQFRNLNIQEARLRRTLDKTTVELKRLQAQRKREEPTEVETGFEFATPEMGTVPVTTTREEAPLDAFSSPPNAPPAYSE